MTNELTPVMVVKQFCQAYVAWAKAGAPDGQPFFKSEPLCTNLRIALEKAGLSQDFRIACDQHLETVLPAGEWKDKLPFNKGIRDWIAEGYSEAHHLNQKRLDWAQTYGTSP